MKNIKLNKTENLFKLNDEKSDLIFEVRYVLRFDKFKRNKQKLSNLLYPEQLMKYSDKSNNAFEVQVVYKIKDVEDFHYSSRKDYVSANLISDLVFDKFKIDRREYNANSCNYISNANNYTAKNKTKIIKLIDALNKLYNLDFTNEVSNLVQFFLNCNADMSVQLFFSSVAMTQEKMTSTRDFKMNNNKVFVLETPIDTLSFDEFFNVSKKLNEVRELMSTVKTITAEVDITQKCIVTFEVDADTDEESIAKYLVLHRCCNTHTDIPILTEENLNVVSKHKYSSKLDREERDSA